jgi:hypothetical protein
MSRQPGALTPSEQERRVLAVWAADCAERALPLFEAVAESDQRPRAAIEGLRAFARGELRIGEARALSVAAYAAARDVHDLAAVAAARSAGQAVATAHMAAHALGAAAYAAKAAGLAAPQGFDAVNDEVDWQYDHASPTTQQVLRRLPIRNYPGGTLGAVVNDLQARVAAL